MQKRRERLKWDPVPRPEPRKPPDGEFADEFTEWSQLVLPLE
jgi:hypothetical protein